MNKNDSSSNCFFDQVQSLHKRALSYPILLHMFDAAIIGIELNSRKKYVLSFSIHKMFQIASKMGVHHNNVKHFVRKHIPRDLLANDYSPLFRYADHRDMVGKQLMVQPKLFQYDLLVSNYCNRLCFQNGHSDDCDCICHTFTCPKCKCTLQSKVRLFSCPECSFGFIPDENNEMELVVVAFDILKDHYIKNWPDLFKESKN